MTRYPLEPLARAMGRTVHAACKDLGVSGSTMQEYRYQGVSAVVAERLAERAGFVPYEIWPELLDTQIAEVERECAAPDCTVRFIPGPKAGKKQYCSRTCYMRTRERARYRANPEPKRERQRAYDRLVREARRQREGRRAS